MTRRIVDALGLVGQHDAGDLAAVTDRDLKRPTAPRASDRRAKYVASQCIELTVRQHQSGPLARLLAPDARIKHDTHEVAACRHIAGTRHQMISSPTGGPKSTGSGRFSGLHCASR